MKTNYSDEKITNDTIDKVTNDTIDKVNQAITSLKKGEMILIADDNDRENEADFVVCASDVNQTHLNTMLKHGSGIVCVSIDAQKAKHLQLPLMQEGFNNNHQKTAFTCSVEAKNGVTTGVSVKDRMITLRQFADETVTADDFVRPGHVFPLQSHPLGLFGRRGHTEASLTLMKLANLAPAAVVCEVVDANGNMLCDDNLVKFASEHNYQMITVADIYYYLCYFGHQVNARAQSTLPTEYGDFIIDAVETKDGKSHCMLYTSNIKDNCLLRIHSSCTTGDIFSSLRCDCQQQLQQSLKLIGEQGGILIYLNQEGRDIGLINKIKAYKLQDEGLDTVEANEHLGLPVDQRSYALASYLVRSLDVKSVKLLTNNPDKVRQCQWFGLEVTDRFNLASKAHKQNHKYLKTKVAKLNHVDCFVSEDIL